MLDNKTILITGGTGSFGSKFVPMTLKKYSPQELNELKKKLARTCEHDWNTHHHHCRKCGLDYEFYRQKGLWTR